jgi:predicted O-methyltransferase YrrM
MRPEEIFERIGPLPYMRVEQARVFYDFITSNNLQNCLELGCFHGVSTAYLAGAIQDLGAGHLTTIDLTTAVDRKPNVEWILGETGLRQFVQVFLEPRSFNWRLMKFLEEGRYESFDFCYIDGGHTWYDTGLAFCLIQRLLKPGGWVVFDDLAFTFRESSNRDKSWVRRMPEEEQTTPQIKRVFDLLVETDPHFGSFRHMGQFGFARKEDSAWSKEQRGKKNVEAVIARALERAGYDPEFRVMLLRFPTRALSLISGMPESEFIHLCFLETDHIAPIPNDISEYGSTIVYVAPPTWERTISEQSLEAMLRR